MNYDHLTLAHRLRGLAEFCESDDPRADDLRKLGVDTKLIRDVALALLKPQLLSKAL